MEPDPGDTHDPYSFQFLGIPPKGEPQRALGLDMFRASFPISRDPPEGGTEAKRLLLQATRLLMFPISRDPPEGGTLPLLNPSGARNASPICEGSRKKSAKRAPVRGLWGLKALWRKASRDPTQESAFAAFGGSIAELLIPFFCAFENIWYLSRERVA